MEITSEIKHQIETRLNEYLRSTEPDKLDLRRVAAELHALPLMLDMGGCLAIRPYGEIVSFAWDEEQNYVVERDRRLCNIALFQGSEKYPELLHLITPRTLLDKDCPHCDGTGIHPINATLRMGNILCYCGGLGWIPGE